MNKTKSIELVRVIFAVLVVVLHFTEFFGTGSQQLSNTISVCLEFFFMLSGFLMMRHIEMSDKEESGIGYVIHKAKGFFLPLCIVNVVQFIVVCIANNLNSVTEILSKLWHFKWEFILLQCAGMIKEPQFNSDYLIGATWYLSAMMIAMVFVFSLVKRAGRIFTELICPLSALLIYCYISQKYGNINVGNEFAGPVQLSVLRAFAGLCMGVLCYQAFRALETKDIGKSKLFTVLDIAAWISIPFTVLYGIFGKDDNAIFLVIPFAMIIILGFTDKTLVSRAFNRLAPRIVGVLGNISLYVYLAHWTIIMCLVFFCPQLSLGLKAVIVAAGTIIYAALLYWICKWVQRKRP